MMPYILMFVLSCLNFRLAYLLRKYKTIKILFVLIGLLLPCVLAGARDNTIGTDVLVYGDAYLNYAQRYNSLSSFMNFDYLGGEPLFKILSYVSAHYFGQFGYYFANLCNICSQRVGKIFLAWNVNLLFMLLQLFIEFVATKYCYVNHFLEL